MTKQLLFLLSILLLSYSCKPKTGSARANQEHHEQADSASISQENQDELLHTLNQEEKPLQVKAKFLGISWEHQTALAFENAAGEKMYFLRSEATAFPFKIELPEEAYTELNQGIGSNPKLQDQWFLLTYEFREEAAYLDGPIGEVKIILEVKPR